MSVTYRIPEGAAEILRIAFDGGVTSVEHAWTWRPADSTGAPAFTVTVRRWARYPRMQGQRGRGHHRNHRRS